MLRDIEGRITDNYGVMLHRADFSPPTTDNFCKELSFLKETGDRKTLYVSVFCNIYVF